MKLLLGIYCILSLAACTYVTALIEPEEEPITEHQPTPHNKEVTTDNNNDENHNSESLRDMEKPEDKCTSSSTLEKGEFPLFLPEQKIVVTRIIKDCVTFSGEKGFEKDSPWMAMGIPCTGGGGKIDIKGHRYSPKLVSFIFATDCAMQPSVISEVKNIGQKSLGLTEKAQLLAYNPFVVQYWEIPGLQDADVGFTVDLRSIESKQRVWKNFLENDPIPVLLYGRENAWVIGGKFYYIQGEIVRTGDLSFRIDVKEVKALDDQNSNKLRQTAKL
ncbi:MAG: hypothetical protein R3B45_04845 [Bdellovibrionota bacterium]